MNQWPETLRYPTTSDSNAVSQNNLARINLDSSAPSLRQRLYKLLAMYTDYSTFSNEAWLPFGPTDTWDSIESVHNVIHVYTGWNAHMAYIDYSAFDPVFFLHHAMMDRVFAMWQVLNPTSFVVPEPSRMVSFTTAANDIQDGSTPLTPFHNDTSGNFWDSNSARYASTFRYAYPETANVVGMTTEELQASVRTSINRLYGSMAAPLKTLKARGTVFGRDGRFQEWIANIRVKKHALQSSFFVYFFLGPISTDSAGWSLDQNLVGTQGVFTKANCTSCNLNQLITSAIPINHALELKVANGYLPSLDPTDVKSYLECNLRYRVTRTDHTEVPNQEVDGLEVIVVMSEVQGAVSEDEFPQWGASTKQLVVNANQ
jgi:tyrosinase